MMQIYETKKFKKWAAKNKISDEKLLNAISEIDSGLGIVNLGGDLYKARIAKNKGKSGGYRTIIIYKKGFRSLFIHGYEKNDKSDISDVEKQFYKNYARDFLNYSKESIEKMLKEGEIFDLENG
ncbi:MAG: type II toxin-antitoxin system RelE/ParE family toxin [Candidatus Fibromonas sp.]|jgi:hypothetical protein|nr:type II toxin-antitoxin system RelE/ParE family toxin [Candidatus Fibromonas sp.]